MAERALKWGSGSPAVLLPGCVISCRSPLRASTCSSLTCVDALLYDAAIRCFAIKPQKFLQPLMSCNFIGLSSLPSLLGQKDRESSQWSVEGQIRSQESRLPTLPLMCAVGLWVSRFPSLGLNFSSCRTRKVYSRQAPSFLSFLEWKLSQTLPVSQASLGSLPLPTALESRAQV